MFDCLQRQKTLEQWKDTYLAIMLAYMMKNSEIFSNLNLILTLNEMSRESVFIDFHYSFLETDA